MSNKTQTKFLMLLELNKDEMLKRLLHRASTSEN